MSLAFVVVRLPLVSEVFPVTVELTLESSTLEVTAPLISKTMMEMRVLATPLQVTVTLVTPAVVGEENIAILFAEPIPT